jgi:hypothetical protein
MQEFKQRHYSTSADVYARVAAVHLSELNCDDVALPLLSTPIAPQSIVHAKKAEIISMVFNKIPIANDTTPWEAIIDWRNDPEARAKFARLRVWVNSASRGELSTAELSDSMEALLADYSAYMSDQHAKIGRGYWELTCTAVVKFLEELPRIKLSPALDVAFHASRSHAQLIEAERKAPGREVAYLLATHDRFAD